MSPTPTETCLAALDAVRDSQAGLVSGQVNVDQG